MNTSLEAYQGIEKQLEGLDISVLVNNVGNGRMIGPFNEFNPQLALEEVNINVLP